MITYNIHEAKIDFPKLLERVMMGDKVVTAKAGKPVARIFPVVAPHF